MRAAPWKIAPLLRSINPLPAAQGNFSEAEPLYKRSLSIREKVLGPDHPDVARSLNDLAGVLAQQARAVTFTGVLKVATATVCISSVSVPQRTTERQRAPGPNPHHRTMDSLFTRQ